MKENLKTTQHEKLGLNVFYLTFVFIFIMYTDNISMFLRGGILLKFKGYSILDYSIFIFNILTVKFFIRSHPEIKTNFLKILGWVFIIYLIIFILLMIKNYSHMVIQLGILWIYPGILLWIIIKNEVTTDE